MPITAYGDEKVRIGLRMKNVDIEIKDGFSDIDLLQVCNFDEILLENVSVKGFDGEAAVRTWSDGKITIENSTGFDTKNAVKKATKPFFSKSI